MKCYIDRINDHGMQRSGARAVTQTEHVESTFGAEGDAAVLLKSAWPVETHFVRIDHDSRSFNAFETRTYS